MKKLLLLMPLILFLTAVDAQSVLIEFDDTIERRPLIIDTFNNPSCIWQIGPPQKTTLNSAISNPNVIITDTINPYPINNTSSFTIKTIAGIGYLNPPVLNHTASLAGYYYVNSDSLNDKGGIELSIDSGVTWIDLIYDTVTTPSSAWITPRPVLSGNSGAWKYFRLNLRGGYSIDTGDVLLFKFSFTSDSIFDGLDGLMYDNFWIDDFAENIVNHKKNNFDSKVYPNPVKDVITFNISNGTHADYEVKIFDFMGQTIKYIDLVTSNTEYNIRELPPGIYSYKILNKKKNTKSSGRFIVE